MRQLKNGQPKVTRAKASGMIIAAYLLGMAGGLFLYPYIPLQALLGFGLLGIGLLALAISALRPERS